MESLSNLSFLKSFTGGDSAKIRKYVNMFLGFTPQSIETMKSQVASGDWKGLRTSAHSLKSQVKYMGIASAEEIALFIEKSAGEETDLDQIPSKMAELEQITTAASAELKAEIDKL